jgi:hypothetical protein
MAMESASGSEEVGKSPMNDQNPLSDPNATPEDVATLYSWANLHGAKYRDFSAARAQTREMVRLRAERAAEEQRRAFGRRWTHICVAAWR